MSRMYRVTVRGTVRRVVRVEDGVCTTLDLLPIVSRERTSELVATELARRGFSVEGAVARRREPDAVVVEVDLATGAVSVKTETTANIEVARTVTTPRQQRRAVDDGSIREAQRQADERSEAAAQAAEARARTQVAERLEKRLGDLGRELDAIAARVTAEALKEKARSLGEIEEIHEEAEGGDLTIKVRL